jgi:(E)-4-hydroxy-3-methylbut-2-enyl-diphosphate synthase
MIIRRKARQIKVGDVKIGGNAPISIQSMTKTDTRDAVETVRQIKKLEKIGCEIIRVAVLDIEAARAIRQIKKSIKIPLVADIHFHYRLAIEAIKAGADKIRLNPGNIKNIDEIAEVVKLAKKRKVPIRIGLNSGSVPNVIARSPAVGGTTKQSPYGEALHSQKRDCFASSPSGTSLAMTDIALGYIKLFERMDFYDIIISLKASDVLTTISAYREMARLCDYPFHLGITAAGPSGCGIIKSSVGIGTLLAEGVGDTIRVSLTAGPEDEVIAAREILRALGLKRGGIDIISCPTCGRCEVDLIKIVQKFEDILNTQYSILNTKASRPLKIAIMGCVVNGPGEAKEADIGLAAGKKSGILFKKGKMIKKIGEKDFIKVLLHELNLLTQ